jgi:hypothetical protein
MFEQLFDYVNVDLAVTIVSGPASAAGGRRRQHLHNEL